MERPTKDQVAAWKTLSEMLPGDLGRLAAYAAWAAPMIDELQGDVQVLTADLAEARDEAAGWTETAEERQRDLEEILEASKDLVHAIGRIRPQAATEGDTMAVVDLQNELRKFEAIS